MMLKRIAFLTVLLSVVLCCGFLLAAEGPPPADDQPAVEEGAEGEDAAGEPAAEGPADEEAAGQDTTVEPALLPLATPEAALETKETVETQIGTIKQKFGDQGDYSLFGVDPTEYVLCFIFLLAGFTARALILGLFGRIGRFAKERGEPHIKIVLDGASQPVGWTLVMIGLWFAILVLPIDPNHYAVIHRIFVAASIIIGIWMLSRLIDILTDLWMESAENTETKLDDQIVPIIRSTSKVFVVLVGIVMVLQNVGVNVTGLFAGLGIGGMALALASKDFMTNLFGGVVIFLDRPFQIGDWIEIDDIEGTVEEVGLRTTRVRTFARSLITVPNQVFTTGHVNNWSQMGKRRIKTSVGLTYDTSAEQMEAAVEKIRQIIRDDDNLRNDFFLVNFNNYGASSLDIFIYCFTWTTNWAEFMDAQQKFYLTIMRSLKEMGLECAFPTTTVHLVEGENPEEQLRKVPD